MGGSIRLHPEKGVNPFLTYCPRCKGESPELILVGANDGVFACPECKINNIGRPDNGKCGGCGYQSNSWSRTRTLKEGERLPGGLCEACKKEEVDHKAVVADGGVYFKCTDCGCRGVIKKNGFADRVRERLKTPAPKPCGVEFSKDQGCPKCGEKKDV